MFGPDGTDDGKLDLYVSSAAANSILRYDGTSGRASSGPFVDRGVGGLDHPGGLTFGPDGNLYVANLGLVTGHTAVLHFDGTTGAPKPLAGNSGADFVAAGVGGLLTPYGVLFGPDGLGDGGQDLYVTSSQYQTHPRRGRAPARSYATTA